MEGKGDEDPEKNLKEEKTQANESPGWQRRAGLCTTGNSCPKHSRPGAWHGTCVPGEHVGMQYK